MKTATKTLIFAATSTALLLGAAQAYAAENVLVADDGQSRMWIYDKAAPRVSELEPTPARIRVTEDLPELIVPLNTDIRVDTRDAADLSRERMRYDSDDLRNIDLVPDSPFFIGGQSSEFDTLEAQRARAGYDRTLGVDPLVPVAGAGFLTEF